MNHNEPGMLQLQDSIDSEVRTQNLKKGNSEPGEQIRLLKEALENITQMKAPGIKPIKQVELAKKWRPLVLDEYQDDICPIPSSEIMMKFKESSKSTVSLNSGNALSKI